MNKLMIIADDLTGACDTGIKFAQNGYATRVILPNVNKESILDEKIDVFSLTTETRNDSVEKASEVVDRLLNFFGGDYRFYKKIDSVLRGNIKAELDCFINKGYAKNALICSAYIEQGRKIENGILTIKNSCDKKEVNIANCLGLDDYKLISLSTINKGPQAIVDFINENTNKYFIADATTNEDLCNIAKAAILLENTIPAGSAGLASQYVNHLYPKKEIEKKEFKKEGYPLFVIGTGNPVTVNQVQELKKYNLETYILNTDNKGNCESKLEVNKKEEKDAILLTTNLIYDDIDTNNKLLTVNHHNNNVMETISNGCKEVYKNNDITCITAAGGDICSGVLEALGFNKIDLIEEIMPGIPAGIASGNENEVYFISKSGGFGDKDALIKILNYVR